ncbi:MAG: hypothetical protein SWO11_17835 [Thermodesulfobacteriota bacterium]|nr:hypothetical protein [Thermodesulfobacteriota bacterium]
MVYISITVLFVLAIYSILGIILAHIAWKDTASRTEKLVFASVIGLAFICYISIIIAYFFAWKPLPIIGSILVFAGMEFSLKTKLPHTGRIAGSYSWTKVDFIASAIVLFLLTTFLFVTFSQIGLATKLGYRYSWLFGHYFINKAY